MERKNQNKRNKIFSFLSDIDDVVFIDKIYNEDEKIIAKKNISFFSDFSDIYRFYIEVNGFYSHNLMVNFLDILKVNYVENMEYGKKFTENLENKKWIVIGDFDLEGGLFLYNTFNDKIYYYSFVIKEVNYITDSFLDFMNRVVNENWDSDMHSL